MSIRSWKNLSVEEKSLYIDLLWQDGHSEQAIAIFLKTTKGAIVGHRNRYVSHVTRLSTKIKSYVDPERFKDLLELECLANAH
jgi:hypothetical protein